MLVMVLIAGFEVDAIRERLETLLGKGQATKETFSEARRGSASGGAPFNFCSSAGIYISLAFYVKQKILPSALKLLA